MKYSIQSLLSLAALGSAMTLGVLPARAAESCTNDIDCPNPACGGDVCNWNKGQTCNPAGTDGPGEDGWCTTDADCKCKGEGATCNLVYCTFTKPPGSGGSGGAATGGAATGGAATGGAATGGAATGGAATGSGATSSTSGGAGAGPTSSAGSSAAGTAAQSDTDDGGCSMTPAPRSSLLGIGVGLGLAALIRRRRRAH